MFQNLDVFKTAMAMARHAGMQQAVSAQNIANADTPRYRAHDMPDFREALRSTMLTQRATRVRHLNGSTADAAPAPRERRETVDPNGNTVSIETEMITAVNAARAHTRALSIYRSNLTLLRASLGR